MEKKSENQNVMSHFSKLECVKFQIENQWYYGWIDNIYNDHCEVSYGTKKMYEECLTGDRHTLDNFCDVNNEELISLNRNRFEK